jgi:hypothetical protein
MRLHLCMDMKHLQFIFLFTGVISLHFVLGKFTPDEGWKMVSVKELASTPMEEPVIVYASLSPRIHQLKWHCLSGELRISRIDIRTTRGEEHSYTLSPSVLHAGNSTHPLDLSDFKGDLASVALWYDGAASTTPEKARLELLGSSSIALAP